MPQPAPAATRPNRTGVVLAVVAALIVLVGVIAVIGSGVDRSPSAASAEQIDLVLQDVPAREITSREWAVIAKAPDEHRGERLIVFGHVTQFDSVTGTDAFRANVDGERQEQAYGYAVNTILQGSAAQLADVVADDVFRAEVTVLGSYSYETTLGGTLTVPMLQVDTISRV